KALAATSNHQSAAFLPGLNSATRAHRSAPPFGRRNRRAWRFNAIAVRSRPVSRLRRILNLPEGVRNVWQSDPLRKSFRRAPTRGAGHGRTVRPLGGARWYPINLARRFPRDEP